MRMRSVRIICLGIVISFLQICIHFDHLHVTFWSAYRFRKANGYLISVKILFLGEANIVLNYEDKNNDESRQWCQDNHMDMIMIKKENDYEEVTNKLTSESVDAR